MDLNERERRELNEIAERLECEDARLATMLSDLEPRRRMSAPSTLTIVIAIVLLVLAIAAAAAGQSPSGAIDNDFQRQPHFETNQIGSPPGQNVQKHQQLG